MITIPMTVETLDVPVAIKIGSTYHVYPEYDGITQVTPNNVYQLLDTANKLVKKSIIVAPIPSNYGRIVLSGGFLKIY